MHVITIQMQQMMRLYAEWEYDCDGNCINDSDQDEVCDEEDNCIEVVNPDQEDSDNDGEGDL